MYKALLISLLLLCCEYGFTQKSGQTDLEIGVNGGVCWYNGDLNPNVYFGAKYMHEVFGLTLKRNLNQRFALKAQVNRGTLSADDQLAYSTFQTNRNLNFTSIFYDGAVMLEFNFLEFDALIGEYRFSPYTMIGIGGIHHNPTTEVEGGVYELRPLQTEGASYSKVALTMPFGLGFKLAVTDRIILSTEWSMRRAFTDYLDDVSSRYPLATEIDGISQDLSDRSLEQAGPDGSNWGAQRGQAFTKDWYSLVTATLSIRLGPKKGSCKHLRI